MLRKSARENAKRYWRNRDRIMSLTLGIVKMGNPRLAILTVQPLMRNCSILA